MIKGVTLYHVICDGCGNTYPHNGVNEEVFFERKTALMTCIYAGWAKVDGKLYCPECHEHNVKAGKYKLINKKNRHSDRFRNQTSQRRYGYKEKRIRYPFPIRMGRESEDGRQPAGRPMV